MITNYPKLTRFWVALLDIGVTFASYICAAYLRNWTLEFYAFGGEVNWHAQWEILVAILLVWRGLFGFQETYVGQRFTSLKADLLVVLKTILFGTLIILTFAFLIKSNVPRTLIFIFAIVNLIFLFGEKALLYQFIGYLRRQGKNIKRILVLGAGDVAKAFVDSVEKYPDWGIKVIGLICKDELNVGGERFGYKLVGHTAHLRELLYHNPIDELVIALPAKYFHTIEDAMAICDEEGIPVRIVSPFFKNLIAKAKTDMIHGLPIIKFSSVERNDFEAALKRSIDIVVSFILLILLAPLFGFIALLIKLDSKGSVFYKWKVLGLNKRPLTSHKFRTMVKNADDLKEKLDKRNEMNGIAFKMKNDPRITSVGKWLRKFSLDELPQLWSVFKGDLSLVGPRPPLQSEVEKYEGWHRRKLSVKPGITCLWQVSGRNEIADFDEWMRLDMKYIDEWSLWLDFKILFKTPWVVLKGTGR
jgi:exopolysaccharide biosynthesis polyprenyl glycosylphosphotransferase